MRGRLAGGSWAPSANCPHESARVASTQIRGRADAPLAATDGSHCWQPLLPLSRRPSCRSSRLLSSTSPALLLLAAGCCPACLACLPAYLPGLPACLRTCVPARAHTGGHPAACGAVHGRHQKGQKHLQGAPLASLHRLPGGHLAAPARHAGGGRRRRDQGQVRHANLPGEGAEEVPLDARSRLDHLPHLLYDSLG